MARMVKAYLTISLLLSMFFLTSCVGNQRVDKKDIQNNAEQMMECIVDSNSEGLFDYFNKDMKDNYSDQTLQEIGTLFDYIDGKIVSYEYKGPGGGEENKHNGKVYYYDCYPKFEITTDTEKTYTIRFSYHYIWDEHPEYEGVNMIFILEDNDYDTELIVGRNYYKD